MNFFVGGNENEKKKSPSSSILNHLSNSVIKNSNTSTSENKNGNTSKSVNDNNTISRPIKTEIPSFETFTPISLIRPTDSSSNFPLKKLSKRVKTAEKLSEFEKRNLECHVVSHCLSSSQTKSLTLTKLMNTILSSHFNDYNMNNAKFGIGNDLNRLKEIVKRLQLYGFVDVTISNLPTLPGKYCTYVVVLFNIFFLFYYVIIIFNVMRKITLMFIFYNSINCS